MNNELIQLALQWEESAENSHLHFNIIQEQYNQVLKLAQTGQIKPEQYQAYEQDYIVKRNQYQQFLANYEVFYNQYPGLKEQIVLLQQPNAFESPTAAPYSWANQDTNVAPGNGQIITREQELEHQRQTATVSYLKALLVQFIVMCVSGIFIFLPSLFIAGFLSIISALSLGFGAAFLTFLITLTSSIIAGGLNAWLGTVLLPILTDKQWQANFKALFLIQIIVMATMFFLVLIGPIGWLLTFFILPWGAYLLKQVATRDKRHKVPAFFKLHAGIALICVVVSSLILFVSTLTFWQDLSINSDDVIPPTVPVVPQAPPTDIPDDSRN